MSFAKCAIYLTNFYVVRKEESLPTWERGLKQSSYQGHRLVNMSLPTWERGLKLFFPVLLNQILCRSPRGSVD